MGLAALCRGCATGLVRRCGSGRAGGDAVGWAGELVALCSRWVCAMADWVAGWADRGRWMITRARSRTIKLLRDAWDMRTARYFQQASWVLGSRLSGRWKMRRHALEKNEGLDVSINQRLRRALTSPARQSPSTDAISRWRPPVVEPAAGDATRRGQSARAAVINNPAPLRDPTPIPTRPDGRQKSPRRRQCSPNASRRSFAPVRNLGQPVARPPCMMDGLLEF